MCGSDRMQSGEDLRGRSWRGLQLEHIYLKKKCILNEEKGEWGFPLLGSEQGPGNLRMCEL